jgi:hypothetical protein
MNDIIKFAEWLRVKFQNNPEDLVENDWYDLFYTIDDIHNKKYTTEELYIWWCKNVNKK